jgi:hypothetical protein
MIQVHAAGIQAGTLNFNWLHKYSAVDRFQGNSISLNLAARF